MRLTGGERGITLLEVVLSIVIIAIIVPGLLLAITHGSQGGLNAEIMTTATFIAQEKMEQKIAEKRKAGGYAALGTGSPAETDSPATHYARMTAICYWDPTPQSQTTPCDNNGTNTGYKIITVTVQHTAAIPFPVQDVALRTLVTDY